MATFNRVTICGFLGRDCDTRYLSDGTAVANFSIATTEKRKEKGEMQEVTTWFRCTMFGKQADALSQYLLKGKQVFVMGSLSLQEYVDRDGNKRTALEVRVQDIQLIGSKSDSQEVPQQRAASAGRGFAVEKGTGRVVSPPIDDDNEIPF